MSYSGWTLSETSRETMIEFIRPFYPDVLAHHVTHIFGSDEMPPKVKRARVVGYSINDRIEAFVVEIDGSIKRPDGKIYHITYSLDRSRGARPVHSNDLIAEYWAAVPEDRIFDIELTPFVEVF